MSRNSKYEARKKAQGFEKVTVWVPVETVDDIKAMATWLCENREYIPFMARNIKTGKMAKAV